MSFAVFIARKSGRRTKLDSLPRHWKLAAWRMLIEIHWLALAKAGRATPELELAQLALRRCLYLTRELGLVHRCAPEAAVMVARSIIETALVGSYLTIQGAGGAERLMKK